MYVYVQYCETGSQRESNETGLIKRRSRRKEYFLFNYESKYSEESGKCPAESQKEGHEQDQCPTTLSFPDFPSLQQFSLVLFPVALEFCTNNLAQF